MPQSYAWGLGTLATFSPLTQHYISRNWADTTKWVSSKYPRIHSSPTGSSTVHTPIQYKTCCFRTCRRWWCSDPAGEWPLGLHWRCYS